MKKIWNIILSVVCVILIVVGCVFWYRSSVKLPNNVPSNDNNVSGETESKNSEPIFTKENYPRVDASLAIHPLVDSIASDFLGIPVYDLGYKYTTGRSSDVYKNLIDGNVDVIFAAEPSSGDLEYAKSKGVNLKVIPATSSAFVFIVNSKNPVENLTLDQVLKIYKGDITNWKEVGGDDEEIIPYQRPKGSGSQTAMISLVMKDESLMSAPLIKIEEEMTGIIDMVAAEYDNSKAAIGYSYFYFVNTMYKKDTIKMLGIDGVKPTIETIKDGTYPIFTNGYIVLREDESEDSNATKWVNAVLSERGSKIIEDAGYVPVNY